ncbi:hypothetical protein ACX1N5_04095 [Acinetobacter sp. ANC 4636]
MIKTPLGIVLGGAGISKKGITQLGGGTVSLNQLITQLFANSEQGFTQTPSDLTTLYQDALGTTPVTAAGQTLGLVLDKSKGLVLGSELVTNGDFSNGTTGWTPTNVTQSATNQKLTLTSTGTSNEYSLQSVPTVVGVTYILTCYATASVSNALNNSARIRINQNISFIANVSAKGVEQKLQIIFTATSTSTSIELGVANTFAWGSVGDSATFRNVSFKSLIGNHSYQTTSSMRPLLKDTPRRIQYDGIDDKLTTTLPAQLTGCTVIRAIPNVGTQILTNQTIPTTYNDSTSHCGLIVINRALTAYEISLVTQIFNKLAGV